MSRSELQKTIEQQKTQISAYEKKLKDVIRAYKGLLAEKEALQTSLNALSPDKDISGISKIAEENNSTNTSSASSDSAANYDRVEALRKSLATLTQEKNRNEMAFQADKKLLLAEKESKAEAMKKQNAENEAKISVLEQKMNELRARLRQSQTERDNEQSDHKAVLNEMQSRFTKERIKAQKMESKIAELYRKVQEKSDLPFAYQDQIVQLNAEIGRLKQELAVVSERAEVTPTLDSLRTQIHQLKLHHHTALEEERLRAVASATQLASFGQDTEGRVGQLESRLWDVSNQMSDYERQHQEDLLQMDRLKSRIQQLDQENSVLASAAIPAKSTYSSAFSSSSSQFICNNLDAAIEQLRNAVDQMRKMDPGANLYSLLNLESPTGDEVHEICRKNYEHLSEEFEKYKLKAHAILKTKQQQQKGGSSEASGGEDDSSDNIDHLKSVIAQMHKKIQNGVREMSDQERGYQETVNGLRHTIAEMQTSHEREVARNRALTQQKMSEMEAEMQKQRSRALDVLSEKESELETLRTVLNVSRRQKTAGQQSVPSDPSQKHLSSLGHCERQFSNDEMKSGRSSCDGDEEKLQNERKSSITPASISTNATDELQMPPTEDVRNVYYQQELLKKEQELKQFKKTVRNLETGLSEMQHSTVAKDLRNFETIEKLKEEIRALESKLLLYREDAHLEYLKNVFVQFLQSNSEEGKRHMVKAIASVLKFTRKEWQTMHRMYPSPTSSTTTTETDTDTEQTAK